MNLHTQAITLFWMLFSGIMLGVVFDGLRIIERKYHFPKWSIHGLDLLYWLWAALFVFRTLYHSNAGELRFYVFLGLFVGIWIHFLLLSILIQQFMVILLKIVDKFCLFLVRVFNVLVIAPLKLAWKLVKLLFGFLWAILLFILRMLLPFWKLLRWITRPLVRKLRLPQAKHWLTQRVLRLWRKISARFTKK